MATHPNAILLFVLNKQGEGNFLMLRIDPEREASYHLIPIAEWSSRNDRLALYRISLSARKLTELNSQSNEKIHLFCVGKADQENEEPDFDNKEIWSFILTCTISNPKVISIHDLESDSQEVFIDNLVENRSQLNPSKLIDYWLKRTNADVDTLILDARGQEVASIFH